MNNKVIMIEGKDSYWYEQAIFILRPDAQVPKDIVAQAEQIIRAYAHKIYPPNKTFLPKEYSSKPGTQPQPEKVHSAPPVKAKTNEQKKKDKKNLDLILNFALIISCVVLGYVLHGVL